MSKATELVEELMKKDLARAKKTWWGISRPDERGCFDRKKHDDSAQKQVDVSRARYARVAYGRLLNYRETGEILSPQLPRQEREL